MAKVLRRTRMLSSRLGMSRFRNLSGTLLWVVLHVGMERGVLRFVR